MQMKPTVNGRLVARLPSSNPRFSTWLSCPFRLPLLSRRRRLYIGPSSSSPSTTLISSHCPWLLTFCQLRSFARPAEEKYSDDEYLSDDNRGSSPTYANVDDWRWKLNAFLRNPREEEIISTERKDRRDYEYLASLAKRLGIFSQNYGKVVAFSKVPLPNYRADLDDKRPVRKVEIPSRVHNIVNRLLHEHFTHQKISQEKSEIDGLEGEDGCFASDGTKSLLISGSKIFPENEQKDLSQSPIPEDILLQRSVHLRNKQQAWQNSPEGQKMNDFRMSLPAYNKKEELLSVLANDQVLVVSGETGCGKTTQLPQYILEACIQAGRGAFCNIICTQPRRISAISVSERVAAERGEQIGETVGYKVRLEGTRGKDTRLLFCTTGILLRRLLVDPTLRGVSHVIVDEIHERGMNEDFLLIVLKDLLPRRPDLKLVLMSATLNAELFSSYFGGATMKHIPGFTHPVRAHFLEHILEVTGYRLTEQNQIDDYGQDKMWKKLRQIQNRRRKNHVNSLVEDALTGADFRAFSGATRFSLSQWCPEGLGFNLIQAVLCHICKNERDGAVLVFMTGWEDINALKEQLKCDSLLGDPRKVLILACHGAMSSSEQKLIFERPPPSIRKIVLATNMAETSITINDVVFVVDCGKAKETSYDALNKTACLLPSWVSKASARQRRGRAGRVQPGESYHLYPQVVYNAFADYQLPELLRMPLHSLCLQIKSLRLGSIAGFLSKALEPPEPLAVQNSIALLKTIGVLDHKEELTHLGRHLSFLPLEPRIGKMLIIGSIFGCLDPVLTIAAGLSVRDPFMLPADKRQMAEEVRFKFGINHFSDHLALVHAYDGWQRAMSEGTASEYCWKNFLSSQTLYEMHSLRKQFRSLLLESGFISSNCESCNEYSNDRELLAGVICAGLFPGVASVLSTSKTTLFKTLEDGQVLLHQNSALSKVERIPYPWLVFNEKVKTGTVIIRDSTGISDSMLLLFGGKVEPGSKSGHLLMQDGWLEFYMPPDIAETILDLKEELDDLLRRKLENPRLDVHTESRHLFNAVLEFLHGDQNLGAFTMCPSSQSGQIKPELNDVKGLLQSRLRNDGYKPPVYMTRALKNGTFQAKIEIRGVNFVGMPASSKKQAQRNAAADALSWLDKVSKSVERYDTFPTKGSACLHPSKPKQQSAKVTGHAKSHNFQQNYSVKGFREHNVRNRLHGNAQQLDMHSKLSERESTLALKTQIQQMIQGCRRAQ